MYQHINDNIDKIIDSINRDSDIDPYVVLLSMFCNGSVEKNEEFKTTYRKYWQLNAARISNDYSDHYFKILEKYREVDNPVLSDIIMELYAVPTNSKGSKAVQFSFATKLLHTIDNTLPIFDSNVSAFYFFPEIKYKWKPEKKFAVSLLIYGFLEKEYKRIIEHNLLESSIAKFRSNFGLSENYTDQKIIDTLIWRFVAYLRSGVMVNGEMKYR